MFRNDADFEAAERVMVETHLREPLRILSYCEMSDHWHFVAWPQRDGQLTEGWVRMTSPPRPVSIRGF